MLISERQAGKARLVGLILLLWLALLPGFVQAQATPVAPTDDQAILRQSLTLKLDDAYTTKAEIDLPATAPAPMPAVLMLGGSGQSDMNGAGPTPIGWPVFQTYKEMLDNLVRHGFIVYKFNKRGLDTGGQIIDQARSDQRTNEMLVKDAATALRQFLADPRVDKQKVFLLGHSQGSLIAAQVAQLFPGQVKGLVLTGTITDWKTAFDYQLVNRFIEAANQADLNHDGKVSPPELTGAIGSNQTVFTNYREVQLLETSVLPYFSRPTPGQVGPFKSGLEIDKDKDGQLSIEQELRPVLVDQRLTFLNEPDILKSSGESGAALKSLQDGPQLEQILLPLGLPVFFQHSLEDERFPLGKIQDLTAELNAANIPAILNVYPGLTHAFVPGSLLYSLVSHPQSSEGVGQVIPAQLLTDQTTWLLNRLKASPAAPISTPSATPQAQTNPESLPGAVGLWGLAGLLLRLLLKH